MCRAAAGLETAMILLLVVTGYVLVPVMGLALVVAGRLKPETIAPLGTLVRRVFTHRAARITLLLFVWWLGWHFLIPN